MPTIKQLLKPVLFSLVIFLSISLSAQLKRSVEFSISGRYDKHADYVSNYAGRIYNDTLKLYGISKGFNVAYQQEIVHSLSASVSIGYYRLGVSKINGSSRFIPSQPKTTRNIDYRPDSTLPLYSTSKYYYNNFAFGVALNKTVSAGDKFYFDFGIEASGYYSFSQAYSINSRSERFKTNNKRPLEFGVNATVGIMKEYGSFYLRPAFIIPVYQNLKGDKVFYEDKNLNISKWFQGIGVALRVGKFL